MANTLPITPSSSRIVIRPDPAPPREHVTEGGIVVQRRNAEVATGQVVAISPEPGGVYSMKDRVLYAPYMGFTLKYKGEVYVLLQEHEVLGLLDKGVKAADVEIA